MDGKVRTADLLTLRSAIRESEIRRDPAGNPALEKSRQRGRTNKALLNLGWVRPHVD